AVAARSQWRGMIAQMPEDALRTWQPHDQPAGDAYRGYACLVRRTGRIAGWKEWRKNRARANRYSQEERVTSHHGPYAECYAMSNVIGFSFTVKHLSVDSAEPGPFAFKRVLIRIRAQPLRRGGSICE